MSDSLSPDEPLIKRTRLLKAGLIIEPGTTPKMLDRASVLASFGLTEHVMRFTSTHSFTSPRSVSSILDEFTSACSRVLANPPKRVQSRILFNSTTFASLDDPFGNTSLDVDLRPASELHMSSRSSARELLFSVTYTLQDELLGKTLMQIFKEQVTVN
ncbi:unnamed protein product [Calicophoron daubneyi]|uniref:Uncharacterized protein n=1 Tax=Calicophoron daubneyi TaxID=300641 RepID=A0AAV2T4E4_CALDB